MNQLIKTIILVGLNVFIVIQSTNGYRFSNVHPPVPGLPANTDPTTRGTTVPPTPPRQMGNQLLENYLPATMQLLAYYIEMLQYELNDMTTIEPPFDSSQTTTYVPPLTSGIVPISSTTTTLKPWWQTTTTTKAPLTTSSPWWQPSSTTTSPWWPPSSTTPKPADSEKSTTVSSIWSSSSTTRKPTTTLSWQSSSISTTKKPPTIWWPPSSSTVKPSTNAPWWQTTTTKVPLSTTTSKKPSTIWWQPPSTTKTTTLPTKPTTISTKKPTAWWEMSTTKKPSSIWQSTTTTIKPTASVPWWDSSTTTKPPFPSKKPSTVWWQSTTTAKPETVIWWQSTFKPPAQSITTTKKPSDSTQWWQTTKKPSSVTQWWETTTKAPWWQTTKSTAKPASYQKPTPYHAPGYYAPMPYYSRPPIKPIKQQNSIQEVTTKRPREETTPSPAGFESLSLSSDKNFLNWLFQNKAKKLKPTIEYDFQRLDPLPRSLIHDIINEPYELPALLDKDNINEFLRVYDDSFGRYRPLTGKKKIPITKPYVEFLMLYDLLKREAKTLNLNKFDGYTEKMLKDLSETSKRSAERQMHTIMSRMILRNEVQRTDIINRVNAIIKDLEDPQSITAKALRYIPPLQFQL